MPSRCPVCDRIHPPFVRLCPYCYGPQKIPAKIRLTNGRRQSYYSSMKRDAKPKPPEVTNAHNLPWTVDVIRTFPRYGGFRNEWRNRYVDVYQIPPDKMEERMKDHVVSIGASFDGKTLTVALEPIADYWTRIINADWRTYK